MVSPSFTGLSYHPTGSGTSKQVLNLYVPPGPGSRVNGKKPILVCFHNSGGTSSTMPSDMTQADAHPTRYAWYRRGGIVVDVTMTVLDIGGEPTGGGMYRDPNDAEWDLEGAGDDTPQQDSIWAVQWMRYHASQYGGDPDRISVYGVSGASSLGALWVAATQDWANPSSAYPVRRVSSVVQGCIAWRLQSWWHAFIKTVAGGGPSVEDEIHRLESDRTAIAVDFGDAVDSDVTRSSPAYWIPQFKEKNSKIVWYLRTDDVPGASAEGVIDYGINATTLLPNFTALDDLLGLVDRHDPYHGIVPYQQLAAIGATKRLTATGTYTVSGVTPDEVIAGQTAEEAGEDAAAFVMDALQLAAAPITGLIAGPAPGAQWVDVIASAEPVYPLDGEGLSTPNPEFSRLYNARNFVVEGIYINAMGSTSPALTIVDSAGDTLISRAYPQTVADVVAVQRGEIDFGAAADTATDTITAVVAANTIPRITNTRHSASGHTTPDTATLLNDDLGMSISLASTTTVGFERYAGGEDADYRTHWEVLEYTGATSDPNAWAVRSVQQVAIADLAQTATTAAISAIVDYTRCVAIVSGVRNNQGVGTWPASAPTAAVNSNKTVTVARGGATAECIVSLTVVEFTGTNWTVEAFTHTMVTDPPGVREAVTLTTPVSAWNKAFIIWATRLPSGQVSNDETGGVCLPGDDVDHLDCLIHAGADLPASGYTFVGYVVSNPHIFVTHNHSSTGLGSPVGTMVDMATTDASKDFAIGKTVATATTIVIGGGVVGGAVANYPIAHCGYFLKDADEVTFQRGRSQVALSPCMQVVELHPVPSGSEGGGLPVGKSFQLGRGMQFNARGLGFKVDAPGTEIRVYYRLMQ